MAVPDIKPAEKDILSPISLNLALSQHGKGYLYSIRWAHRLKVNEDWGFSKRVNSDGHLLWALGGKGKYRIRDQEVDLLKGTYVFVGPGVIHEAWADPEDPPEIIPVRFDINALSPSGRGALEGRSFHGNTPNTSLLEALFEELHRQSLAMKGEFRRSLCNSLIHNILSLSHLERSKSSRTSLGARLERSRFRMSEEIPAPPVRELAEECHLSERHFGRVFSEAFGMSPRDFRLSVVMDKAQGYLLEGQLSIAEIAQQLGYGDAFSFSRQFKLRTGSSPLRWRKENR